MNSAISHALIATAAINPKHFSSLFHRETGSQFNKDFGEAEFLSISSIADMPWKQLPREDYVDGTHLSICEYFYLDGKAMDEHFPDAQQRIETTNTINPEFIDVAKSKHNDLERGQRVHELNSTYIITRPCCEAWLIVGPGSDEDNNPKDIEMVWTWFPGELTPSLPSDWDGSISSLDLSKGYAVKAA